MKIAAISDLHLPIYYKEFIWELENLREKIDVFLLAGDIISGNNVKDFEKFYNSLFGKIDCPIIMVFGNNEFDEAKKELKNKFKEIIFLDDQTIKIEINQTKVEIIGSTGVLDRPTSWQEKNIPNIHQIYDNRIEFIKNSILSSNAEFIILLLHYTPTFKILEGEPLFAYPSMGSQRLEKILVELEKKPNLIVHGHSHKGKKMVWIDKIPVFNVAFPVNKQIVVIDTQKLKPGIMKFI